MSVQTKNSFKSNNSAFTNRYKNFFLFLFLIIVISIASIVVLFSLSGDSKNHYHKVQLKDLRNLPEKRIDDRVLLSNPRNEKCTYWDCFNVYRCGQSGHDRITIYVYPLRKYVDARGVPATEVMSQEFYTILETIINSKYYTADPSKACIFVPSIDLLSQNRFQPNITSRALNLLPL